jgi:hypothetical protein
MMVLCEVTVAIQYTSLPQDPFRHSPTMNYVPARLNSSNWIFDNALTRKKTGHDRCMISTHVL